MWDEFCFCVRTYPDFDNLYRGSESLLRLMDGGNRSAVVYCRWLHSTAASHSADLLSLCKCPLTLTPRLSLFISGLTPISL